MKVASLIIFGGVLASVSFFLGRSTHTGFIAAQWDRSLRLGDFVFKSYPADSRNLGVFEKMNATDLSVYIDAPVKITGVGDGCAYGEKVFSPSGEYDKTRDLLRPYVPQGATSAFFILSAGEKKLRWFADPLFKVEITKQVPDPDAVTVEVIEGGSPQRKSR